MQTWKHGTIKDILNWYKIVYKITSNNDINTVSTWREEEQTFFDISGKYIIWNCVNWTHNNFSWAPSSFVLSILLVLKYSHSHTLTGHHHSHRCCCHLHFFPIFFYVWAILFIYFSCPCTFRVKYSFNMVLIWLDIKKVNVTFLVVSYK